MKRSIGAARAACWIAGWGWIAQAGAAPVVSGGPFDLEHDGLRVPQVIFVAPAVTNVVAPSLHTETTGGGENSGSLTLPADLQASLSLADAGEDGSGSSGSPGSPGETEVEDAGGPPSAVPLPPSLGLLASALLLLALARRGGTRVSLARRGDALA